MAVELGSKIVKDTESYNDYAIGLSLPLQFGNSTFNQTFQTSEQVKSNIKNLNIFSNINKNLLNNNNNVSYYILKPKGKKSRFVLFPFVADKDSFKKASSTQSSGMAAMLS